MTRYIVLKLASLVLVLWGISLIVFFLIHLVPGDVVNVLMGQYATADRQAELRTIFGLDRPIHLQYLEWLGGVLQGDLGNSFFTGRSIKGDLLARFPVTLELSLVAAMWAVALGITLGVIAGVRPNTLIDGVASVVALIGMAMPSFWLATILILVFAVWLGWLPAIGFVPFSEDPVANLRGIILPSLSLGMIMAAAVTRMTRSAMLEIMAQDYVRTARAKGLREHQVLVRHALKNALLPVITIIGVEWAKLLGGSIIIEEIFAIPGIGQYAIKAIFARDYAAVQGTVLLIAATFVATNLLVDIAYVYIDPRVKYG